MSAYLPRRIVCLTEETTETLRVKARAGWETIPVVQADELHEITSADILQPGSAALTNGLRQLHGIIQRWAGAIS